MTTKAVAHTLAAVLVAASVTATHAARAQTGRDMGGGNCGANLYNCADTPNPLPPTNTVWLEEMTWMDVRDALKAGKTTAIISTGGFEPNGPWLVTGKHNYVLRSNCEAIARKLGNALCTPIIKLVPEGNIDPPSSHMVSPNALSLREAVYRAMLSDVVQSLKVQGFKNIILIGDSGGNGAGMGWVADSVTKLWAGDPVVAHVAAHYDYSSVSRHMATRGVVAGQGDNLHDDPIITLNMFHTDPATVRWEQRVKVGKATINGFSIADRAKTLELAREVVKFRSDTTAIEILKAIANKGTVARGGGRGGAGGGAPGDSAAGRGGRGGRGGAVGDSAAGRGGRGGGRGGAGADSALGGRGGAAGAGGGGGGRGGANLAPNMRPGAGWGAAPVRPDSSMSMGGDTCGPGTAAAGGRGGGNPWNCAGTPNPAPEANTVWMEELSWMGVRDALKAGKTTVIQPVGGLEPSGPWLALGRPNYMLTANCDLIARKLGNALCGPIMDLVPQGTIEPASGNMRTPGVISLREGTFRAMLVDVALGHKVHGFKHIVLIGESATTQAGMKFVADSLNTAWKGAAVVIYLPDYATMPAGASSPLRTQGVTTATMPSDGLRDDPETTLNMMLANPSSVRWAERTKSRQATINGVSIADLSKSLQLGKAVADARATKAATAIRAKTLPPGR